MGTASEIDVIKAIDLALGGLEDKEARQRVLTWAWGKFASQPMSQIAGSVTPTPASVPVPAPKGRRARRAKGGAPKSKSQGKVKSPLTIVKDLNLKPKDKKSFDDFVAAKQPNSHQERCLVSVYYLKNDLAIDKVTVGHVNTCFKHVNWRRPSDLNQKLRSAGHHGWLDTSDSQDISVTTVGENYVEHDLPKKTKAKKTT